MNRQKCLHVNGSICWNDTKRENYRSNIYIYIYGATLCCLKIDNLLLILLSYRSYFFNIRNLRLLLFCRLARVSDFYYKRSLLRNVSSRQSIVCVSPHLQSMDFSSINTFHFLCTVWNRWTPVLELSILSTPSPFFYAELFLFP